jgi:mono/diheme cytochrome c family protein
MKKITLTLGLVIFALLFQQCKNNTEQEAVTNNETVVQQEIEKIEEINVDETKEDTSVTAENEVSVKNNEVKPTVNTTPKSTKPKTTEPKEVKTTVETSAPIKEDVPTPKEVVVVNEPAPKSEPKTDPKPIVETPVIVPEASNWVIPANYKTMKNPTAASDKENLSIGKTLYAKHCASCHGKSGLGDGSKAPELSGDLGNFSSAKFQKQTDGELFYKLIDGRDDMPGFKKKLPSEEDRWLIVNFMRTLKK